MSMFPNSYRRPADLEYGQSAEAGVLARFFNSVYAWMAAGLAVTAAVALFVSGQPELMRQMLGGPTIIILIIAQLALVFAISAAIQRIGPTAATIMFILYAALNGLTLSVIFLVYAHALIASAFIITAAMFGAMSLYGFVTQRDLTSLGSFLFMGLIGIIIASVVSIFWHPTILVVLINYLGVAIFLGLTAYDTQKLKMMAYQTANNAQLAARLSISGALMLYLDFLNLFLFILSIMGNNDRQR
jgi:hypothetical protein